MGTAGYTSDNPATMAARYRHPILAIGATLALMAGLFALVLGHGPAAAGGAAPMEVTPSEDPTEQRFEIDARVTCTEADAELAVTEPGDGEFPQDAIDVDLDAELTIEAGHATGSFSVAELEVDDYWIHVVCEDEFSSAQGSFTLLRLTVDKVVEGDVPAGTTFEVEVTCEVEPNGSPGDDFEITLDFDEDGGTTSLLPFPGAVCDVEVTDDGGAETTAVDNGEGLTYGSAPQDETTTVTSTFPEAEEEEEPEEEEEEPEAEPAEPVEDEPDYTG